MLSQRGHVTFIHAGVTKFTVRCRQLLLLKPRLSGFHAKHTPHVCPGKMDLLRPNTQHIQHRQLNLFKIFTQPLTHNSLLTLLGHVTGWVFMCSELWTCCSSSSWWAEGSGGRRDFLHLVWTSLHKQIFSFSKCAGICSQDCFLTSAQQLLQTRRIRIQPWWLFYRRELNFTPPDMLVTLCFCKTADKLKLDVTVCWNFSLLRSQFLFLSCHDAVLVLWFGLGTKKHLVTLQKTLQNLQRSS